MRVEIDGPTRLPRHCRITHTIQIIDIEALIEHQKRIVRWKRRALLMMGENKLFIFVFAEAEGVVCVYEYALLFYCLAKSIRTYAQQVLLFIF